MCFLKQFCCYLWFFYLIVTLFADRYDSAQSVLSSSSVYNRRMSNRDGLSTRERERIMKIYQYDNLTDCETACEIPCGTTYVIQNDIDERRQYTCTQRKVPMVSAFIDINNTGILTFVLAAALILFALLLIICCCCIRCGCGCCRRICRSSNLSNDPLVKGEFKETLDSKDIGYLKKEAVRTVVTV